MPADDRAQRAARMKAHDTAIAAARISRHVGVAGGFRRERDHRHDERVSIAAGT
jgi:hypothetical protein